MEPHLRSQLAAVIPAIFLAGCIQHETAKVLRTDAEFTTETLSSIVLRDGREIEFGPEGGHYGASYSVVGVTDSGDTVRFRSNDVREARPTSPPFISSAPTERLRIAEVLDQRGLFYQFDSTRAVCDARSGLITGRLISGVPCNLSVQDIRGFRTERVSTLSMAALVSDPDLPIAEVVVGGGMNARQRTLVRFNADGGRTSDRSEVIEGVTAGGALGQYPLDSILYASVERVNAAGTVLATLGGLTVAAAVVGAIVAATKESCPFVYSYDGSGYVFDGEPLGGATSEVLARTDYSLLEHLRPVNGTYRLLVRNEVAETQFIDAMRLLVVDHHRGQTPVIDARGETQLVRAMTLPVLATDEDGTSILQQVGAIDGVAWQTHLESVSQTEPESLRHTLTFTFVRPRGAQRARLVARVGTTLWGSAMIRCLYELRGNTVERWHTAIDRKGPELYELLAFVEREELFSLRVLIGRKGTWVHRGHLVGGGPFIHETQTVPLSLADGTGDSISIRVRPPLGFWSIDCIGIEFDPGPGAIAVPIPVSSGFDQDGQDITRLLQADDRTFSVMPTKHHWTTLEFPAPPPTMGMERTVFLQTSGYYRLHLPQDQSEDTAMLREVFNTPGSVIRFSLDRYREWYGSVRTLPISETRRGDR